MVPPDGREIGGVGEDAAVGGHAQLALPELDAGLGRIALEVRDELVLARDRDAPEHGRREHLEA